jgi:hypothetical protein
MDAKHNAPTVGSVWRHRNGQTYQVAWITNIGSVKPEYPETVVYVNTAHDTWWARPVSDWCRSFTRVDSDAARIK